MNSRFRALFFERIVAPDLNVNSGVYSAIDSSLRMELSPAGEYKYIGLDENYMGPTEELLKVSAFGEAGPPEDDIASSLFGSSDGIQHDTITGFFVANFAGWVVDPSTRQNASSGGLTTWMLTELMRRGLVDGIIHMHSSSEAGPLFEYRISRTVESVRAHAKTRYYPGQLSDILRQLSDSKERFALVAIPSIAYEIRLLQTLNPVWRRRIPFIIGLLCGHQKTANYAEYLGWRLGIEPGNLHSIDFRKKTPTRPAGDYMTECTGVIGGKTTTLSALQTDLYGTNWGYGFFKPNFSDFTQDAFNETADVVFGDAWIEPFVTDPRGTNIAIVRNPQLLEIMIEGEKQCEITLENLSTDQVMKSQIGLIRHYVEDLPYRFKLTAKQGVRVPNKIRRPSGRMATKKRRMLQQARIKASHFSHVNYQVARAEGNLEKFDTKMRPLTNDIDHFYRKNRFRALILAGSSKVLKLIRTWRLTRVVR